MLDRILSMLSQPTAAPEDHASAARVAIAAILVEAATADGVYLEREKAVIDQVLAERFGLSPFAAAALRREGETAHDEATDLVRFTRVVKDAVAHEDRVSVIEAVWRVVYADDARDADEDNLVRRLAGLLYVPDRDAGLARQRVVEGRT